MVQCCLSLHKALQQGSIKSLKEEVVEIYCHCRLPLQKERWCNAMDGRSGSIAIACVYLPGDPLIGTVPLYVLIQSECIRSMSIMSQFDTKYACFMCATEFPGSDRISLGNMVAMFN